VRVTTAAKTIGHATCSCGSASRPSAAALQEREEIGNGIAATMWAKVGGRVG